MRTQHTLAVILIAVAGCGGVTSQDGEGGDPLITRPPVNQCHAFNPGYISLDSFTAPGWELFGEPLQLASVVTAHQVWPGSGLNNFPHGVVYDGVSIDEAVMYAWPTPNGPTLEPTTWTYYGRIVDGDTPDTHTVSVTSACGTETRTLNVGKTYATTPKPSLTIPPGQTYVNPGTAVTLNGAIDHQGGGTTCGASRAHLVGKQDYDGKIVVDQSFAGNINFFTATVKPALDTTYTLTTYCTMATYAAPQSVTAHVQVYIANSVCPAGESLATWAFCQTCPAAFPWETPWKSTIIDTACSKPEAHQLAQASGANCSIDDGACP